MPAVPPISSSPVAMYSVLKVVSFSLSRPLEAPSLLVYPCLVLSSNASTLSGGSRYTSSGVTHTMLQVQESLCLVLQKLSCNPANRRHFEKSQMVQLLMDLGNRAGSGFLQMNIKSILKHLKQTPVSTSRRSHASAMGVGGPFDISSDRSSSESMELSESPSMENMSFSESPSMQSAFDTLGDSTASPRSGMEA